VIIGIPVYWLLNCGNSAQEYLAILEKKGAITLLDGDRNIHLNNVRLEVIRDECIKRKYLDGKEEKIFDFIKNYRR